MSDLDAEIARIAALRGQPVAETIARAHRGRYPHRHEVDAILHANPDQNEDLRYYDAMSAKSRAFLRGQRWPLNARAWAELMAAGIDEDEIIKAVTFCLPQPRRPGI